MICIINYFTAPESPHEPTVRAGSIPGDYTVHLYKTSTRHSPVRQVQDSVLARN